MGKRYLLDSNTVIDYIAGLYSYKSEQWLNQIIDKEINVSVITKIEVLSFDPDKDDNYPILIDFFKASNTLALTDKIVSDTIKIRQKQKIKLPDAVIAATAREHKFVLVTRNINDFKNIPDLEIVNPYDIQ